ncbi:MAG: hypothetical protein ABR512_07950 [Desulfopila sp.]
MNAIIPALQAIIRDQVKEKQDVQLGIVTQVFTNEGGAGDDNIAVNIRLQGSGCELQKIPVMISRLGMSHAPRVDDLAVMAFVSGDINKAIVLGFLYDEQNRAPDAAPEEIVYQVPDEADDGMRRLYIELPSGNSLTLLDGQLEVSMGSTVITVEADGAVSIKAGGDISINASGALNLEAGGDVSVKGKNVNIEGQAGTKVKGPNIKLAGMTDFSPA